MTYWKLFPVARLTDPTWQDHGYKGPVIVEAGTPAEARLKAGAWELEEMREELTLGNGDPALYSAFENEKLYNAVELLPETFEVEKNKYPFISPSQTGR